MRKAFFLLAVILLPGEVQAQCRVVNHARGATCAPTAVTPSYDAPVFLVETPAVIVQPVLVPAYVFQVVNAYTPPAQAQAAPRSNLSTRDVDLIAYRVAALLRTSSVNEPPPMLLDEPPALEAPRTSGLNPDAIRYFASACYKCHNPGSSKGKLVLFDTARDGQAAWNPQFTDNRPVSASDLLGVIKGGTMPPPPGPKVPDEVVAMVEAWRRQ